MDWKELKNNSRIREIFETRIKILKLTREFFWQKDFKEVETSVAVKFPGQEPYLNPIPVKFHDPNKKVYDFYLQTSPEFAMKKILGAGYKNIFQICKCFRDFEQFGGNHNTEFTMIEWYRVPGKPDNIMDDMENLFKYIDRKINATCHPESERRICFNTTWERISMKELWKRELDINLDENLSLENLSKIAEDLGYKVDERDVYEDVFYKIFLNKIEAKLGIEKPVFVYDYPSQMCSLSKVCENDDRYSQRFELYINGIELANGFGELTVSQKQKQLLESDKEQRKGLGKETWDVDEGFIEAIDNIKDDASGVALGVDRMVMLFAGANNLNEVIFGSVDDQL